ncbi:MAG: nucleoside-diphosphate kinase [Deltaproteobacteria bacterium HGW-Deltaproteobacteria-14]|jgi:nucleoside-diphosphate kinase|nr:MAG: nucleoside-diphosphate kinase [Deltaproteobacteria bacterium HGW-Deltaproteobacteria-14]
MSLQQTLAIVKPDAVRAGNTGHIVQMIEDAGFSIKNMKKTSLTKAQAEGFYYVHAARPFFGELVTFMTSGPVVLMILEAEDAIQKWRDLMGPTDATKAPKDTVRGRFGTSIGENASHGSDAPETAAFETAYFFSCFERK